MPLPHLSRMIALATITMLNTLTTGLPAGDGVLSR
jgi:hypothetical protein